MSTPASSPSQGGLARAAGVTGAATLTSRILGVKYYLLLPSPVKEGGVLDGLQ